MMLHEWVMIVLNEVKKDPKTEEIQQREGMSLKDVSSKLGST